MLNTLWNKMFPEDLGKQEAQQGDSEEDTIQFLYRWHKDERYQESQWSHRWTEEYCGYEDHLAKVDSKYIATWWERWRYRKMFVLQIHYEKSPGNNHLLFSDTRVEGNTLSFRSGKKANGARWKGAIRAWVAKLELLKFCFGSQALCHLRELCRNSNNGENDMNGVNNKIGMDGRNAKNEYRFSEPLRHFARNFAHIVFPFRLQAIAIFCEGREVKTETPHRTRCRCIFFSCAPHFTNSHTFAPDELSIRHRRPFRFVVQNIVRQCFSRSRACFSCVCFSRFLFSPFFDNENFLTQPFAQTLSFPVPSHQHEVNGSDYDGLLIWLVEHWRADWQSCSRSRTTCQFVQEGVDHGFFLPCLPGSFDFCVTARRLGQRHFIGHVQVRSGVWWGDQLLCTLSLSHDEVSSSTCFSISVLFFRLHSGFWNVTGVCLRRFCPHLLVLACCKLKPFAEVADQCSIRSVARHFLLPGNLRHNLLPHLLMGSVEVEMCDSTDGIPMRSCRLQLVFAFFFTVRTFTTVCVAFSPFVFSGTRAIMSVSLSL